MLLIRSTNRRKKFLFLSATPDEQLIQRLRQAGFRCRVIDPAEQGKYQFPTLAEQQEQLAADRWRRVAGSIQLNFLPLESSSKMRSGQKSYPSSRVQIEQNSHQMNSSMAIVQTLLTKVGGFANRNPNSSSPARARLLWPVARSTSPT